MAGLIRLVVRARQRTGARETRRRRAGIEFGPAAIEVQVSAQAADEILADPYLIASRLPSEKAPAVPPSAAAPPPKTARKPRAGRQHGL